jgi:dsDNA-binding SOS-regulon protein
MSKVRFQMFIEEAQKEALEKLQEDSKISLAEMVRKAIAIFLAECKEKKEIPVKDKITQKLLSTAGACKGGPKDLADRHDKYLYGASRK